MFKCCLLYRSKVLSPNLTDFYSLFCCCTTVQCYGKDWALTNIFIPAKYFNVPVPMQEPVLLWYSLFLCLKVAITRFFFFQQLRLIIVFVKIFTFYLYKACYNLLCEMDFGPKNLNSLLISFWWIAVLLTIIPYLNFFIYYCKFSNPIFGCHQQNLFKQISILFTRPTQKLMNNSDSDSNFIFCIDLKC